MYLFAPAAFVMKVTALHLWSIFTPKSGANAKEREKRMHFDVAQRFGASIAGVKQTSLKLDGVTARGREKAVHLLSKPQRRSNCHTARGHEKTGEFSEVPPCRSTLVFLFFHVIS